MFKSIFLALLILVNSSTIVWAADTSWWGGEKDFSLVDLSGAVTDNLKELYTEKLQALLAEYDPALKILQKNWDKKTVEGILEGRVPVQDATINAALAEKFDGKGRVKDFSITSRKDGRLVLHLDVKKIGKLELTGTIDEFVHTKDKSYMVFTVEKKKLVDHRLLSWFFSRLSLSLMEKFAGNINPFTDLPMGIYDNTITVDFTQRLKNSDLAQTSVLGYNLLDSLRIDGAVPHKGYVEFKTNLNVPDKVKTMLLSILR